MSRDGNIRAAIPPVFTTDSPAGANPGGAPMKPIRVIAVAAAFAAASLAMSTATAAPAADVNWTQFRFNQNHTGVNPFETVLNAQNVPTLQIAWQAQLGQLVDFSSPAVVDGVVYIGSTDGRLWAYPSAGCGQSLCTTPLWS